MFQAKLQDVKTTLEPQPPKAYRFTVEEYYQLGEVGILQEDDRIELIDGSLIIMSPVGSRHSATVNKINRIFIRRLEENVLLSPQNPFILSEYSGPESDNLLCEPREDFYRDALPRSQDVLLVIEVADSSLRFDRNVKAPLCAKAGIKDFWIGNLVENQFEIHRQPGPETYGDVAIKHPGDTISPLAFPQEAFAVAELLP